MKTSFGPVINKFEQYCHPRKNVLFQQYCFNCQQQEVGESYKQYTTALHRMAQKSDWHNHTGQNPVGQNSIQNQKLQSPGKPVM